MNANAGDRGERVDTFVEFDYSKAMAGGFPEGMKVRRRIRTNEKGEKYMAFEVVQASARGGGRTGNKIPQMSFYGKTAQFRLNGAAMEALGNPEKIEVHYDSDTGRVALIPGDSGYAVTLRKDSENAVSRYFGFKSLANRAGLADDSRFTVPIELDEPTGYQVADISASVVSEAPTGRRGNKRATGETAEAEAAVTTS